MKNGDILGVVNLVGNGPRLVFCKKAIVGGPDTVEEQCTHTDQRMCFFRIAEVGILFGKGTGTDGDRLRGFLKGSPPVWHLGECLDNARASGFFNGISGALGTPIKGLAFCFHLPNGVTRKASVPHSHSDCWE